MKTLAHTRTEAAGRLISVSDMYKEAAAKMITDLHALLGDDVRLPAGAVSLTGVLGLRELVNRPLHTPLRELPLQPAVQQRTTLYFVRPVWEALVEMSMRFGLQMRRSIHVHRLIELAGPGLWRVLRTPTVLIVNILMFTHRKFLASPYPTPAPSPFAARSRAPGRPFHPNRIGKEPEPMRQHLFDEQQGRRRKTTTAVSLAHGLVILLRHNQMPHRVLLIDTDSKAHATLLTTGRRDWGRSESLGEVLLSKIAAVRLGAAAADRALGVG